MAVVSRKRPQGLPEGVTHHAVDVRDSEALARVCEGRDVILQCLNAPYHRWATEFPPLQKTAIAAAHAASGALVSFENVYMYGAPGSQPFAEDHAHAPCSAKGRVRAEMVDELRELHTKGALRVAHVRASDLFGPGIRAASLGDEVFGRAVAGKAPRGFGNLDAPHTWTYTLDAGETLARVALSADAYGQVWHVPSDAPRSQREVASELATLLGRPVPISATPIFVLKLVGLFTPEAREMIEMLYEFEKPFVVGDERARTVLGQTPTRFVEALAETVRWFQRPSASPEPLP